MVMKDLHQFIFKEENQMRGTFNVGDLSMREENELLVSQGEILENINTIIHQNVNVDYYI
jgi:hypothetical protein